MPPDPEGRGSTPYPSVPPAEAAVLSEFASGRIKAPNRLAFTATGNNLGTNREVTPAQVGFYEDRAQGGVGIITTEALCVHPSSIPSAGYPLAYETGVAADLGRIAEVVHDSGAVVYGQLHHAGGRGYGSTLSTASWGQSADRDFVSGTSPHQMTASELSEIVEAYVATASNLEAAGFDGVELLAAHGFLLSQLLSPIRNQRADRWGGSLEGRCRAINEIVAGIRGVCTDDFVVGVRLGADEFLPGGLDIDEAGRVVGLIQSTSPIDYLSVSQGSFGPNFDRHLPDLRYPNAPYVGNAGVLKRANRALTVMAVGKIPTVEAAEHTLGQEGIDLIGMCRPLLADAQLVAKFREGRRARPCVYCNRCWHELQSGRPAACFYGSPVGGGPAPSSAPREDAAGAVRIIGGGLAGLEFARVAAARGATVTVYEKRSAPGGTLALEAGVPGRDEWQKAVDWLVDSASEAGARLEQLCEVDAAMVDSWPAEDLVVQANGAETRLPNGDPAGAGPSLLSLEEVLEEPTQAGSSVVIVDEYDDEPVYAIAELLAESGRGVQIVTRQEFLGRRVAYTSRIGILRRLDQLGVRIMTTTALDGLDEAGLTLRHMYSGRAIPVTDVDTVVCAGPYAPSRRLIPENRPRAMVIGDALSPRPADAIVREARSLAESL